MKTIVKDMLLSLLIGMVLPGMALNGLVGLLERMEAMTVQAVVQETTAPAALPDRQYPVKVRLPDDTVEEGSLDDYLVGVVLAEMPASFELEALKAQAVAARTYAWKAYATGGKHGDGSICTEPSCCQAYLDQQTYLDKSGSMENWLKVCTAVYETAGQVLTYEGELIEATYFSCSGGSTEDAQAVWGREIAYLQAVDSPGEEAAAGFRDKAVFSAEEFQEKMGITLEGEPQEWFGETDYTKGGGVASMEIGGEAYAGTFLRSELELRSTAFSVSVDEDITITTRGYGHRVGMSQYGADAMAVGGSSYREILAHYYQGTEITEI